MLPLPHRLGLRHNRLAVEAIARTYTSPLFTLLVGQLPDRTNSPSRFAVIISKKISTKATTRNHFKRQILSAIQDKLKNINPGFDTIILAKKSILNSTYDQIKHHLSTTFQQAGII
ncbi:MAG: ribonuclease P [uncultured bacterium]|nr:MAG: ribonuclease P [uncultured bacterium]